MRPIVIFLLFLTLLINSSCQNRVILSIAFNCCVLWCETIICNYWWKTSLSQTSVAALWNSLLVLIIWFFSLYATIIIAATEIKNANSVHKVKREIMATPILPVEFYMLVKVNVPTSSLTDSSCFDYKVFSLRGNKTRFHCTKSTEQGR